MSDLKFVEKIKKDWPFKVFYLCLMIIVILIAITSFKEGDYSLQLPPQNIFANITFSITMIFGLVFYFVFRFFDENEYKIEKLYLCIVIPLGILYCIANPLGMVPDEDQHARKSMAISNGIFFSHKDENGNPKDKFNAKLNETVTRTIESYEDAFRRVSLPETDEEIDMLYSMATYAPICHMPQAFGMFLIRIFGGGVSIQCYAARIFNMLLAIFLTYGAIKIIPFKKQIIFFLGLLPITIMEYASMSSDALTISSCIFFIAYILYLKYDNSKTLVNKKDITILVVMTLVVSLCKIVYVPLALLLFIIPKEKFSSNKIKNIFTIGTFITAIVLNVIWLIYAAGFLTEVNEGVNGAEQVKYILTNPISYCLILFRTIHIHYQTYILSLCGEGLGHYNVQASVLFVFPCLVIFAMLFFINNDKTRKEFDWKTKVICLLIFISIVLLIYTSLYVAWTPLKTPVIYGVQARYFLPVLLLTAIVFDNRYIIFEKEIKNKYLSSFMLFFNLNALSCISYTYIFSYIIEYYIK